MSYSWVIFEDMLYTKVIPVLDRFVAERYIIIAYQVADLVQYCNSQYFFKLSTEIINITIVEFFSGWIGNLTFTL
jgi:hypothetical protein